MKWYKNLYISEKIELNREDLISDILINKNVRKRFLITLPANDKNMLDIITARLGMTVSWREIYVIGVTTTRQEAINMVAEIVMSVYLNTNAFNIKEYFNDFI